jgi:hypothetical protein
MLQGKIYCYFTGNINWIATGLVANRPAECESKPMKKTGISRQVKPRCRGRPPLPDNVSRQHRVVTFVTSRDKTMLNEFADREQVSLSAASHQLIKTGLKEYFSALHSSPSRRQEP